MADGAARRERPAAGDIIAVSACSAAFFEYYLDLIESLDDVGLADRMVLGLIDLGLSRDQRRLLADRDVRLIDPLWPIVPPPGLDKVEYFGFVAKPYLRELFPGYQLYLWLDADMWVQDPAFFDQLCDAAMTGRFAVAEEADPDYRSPTLGLRAWMLNNYRRGFGVVEALRLAGTPLVNNSLAAAHVDAPHWLPWQRSFEQLVERAGRVVAMDQLALQRTLFGADLPVALLPATSDWVCSRALPIWDRQARAFVTPGRRWSGEPRRLIGVMHLTTPTRGRPFMIRDIRGHRSLRFLHRPGGHVARLIEGGIPARPGPGDSVQDSGFDSGFDPGPDSGFGSDVDSGFDSRFASGIDSRFGTGFDPASGSGIDSPAAIRPGESADDEAGTATDPHGGTGAASESPGRPAAGSPSRRQRRRARA